MDESDLFKVINVNNIINDLKVINSTNSKIYNHGFILDYKFNFNEPANEKTIKNFEKKIGNKLPNDYKSFLLLSNGMSFQGEAEFYDINTILEMYNIFDYPRNFIAIGTCMGGFYHILINLNENNDNCIYTIRPIGDDYFQFLNCNFTDFFNKFIISYGSDFWTWGSDPSKKVSVIDCNVQNMQNRSFTETFQTEVKHIDD